MKRAKRKHQFSVTLTAVALLSLVAFASAPASAEDASHGVPGDWLSSYSGARSIGLGGAFVAVADEPIGAVWNPAGLTSAMQYEIHFEQTRLFEGTTMNGVGVVFPFRTFPTLGLSVITLGTDEFERTSELNEPLGTFTESDQAFLLSASKQVHDRVSVGANLKVVRGSHEVTVGYVLPAQERY